MTGVNLKAFEQIRYAICVYSMNRKLQDMLNDSGYGGGNPRAEEGVFIMENTYDHTYQRICDGIRQPVESFLHGFIDATDAERLYDTICNS